jgi:hypothetical protein
MQPAPARLRRCQSPLLTQEIEASHERDLRGLGAAMLFDQRLATAALGRGDGRPGVKRQRLGSSGPDRRRPRISRHCGVRQLWGSKAPF